MMFEVRNLKDSIGAEIRTTIEDLLTPDIAKKVRDVLIARGIVVFKALNLSEEQQRTLSNLMGTLRQEGQNGVIKITLDKSLNAKADYLKGSWFWHIDGTHDSVPPFASLLTGITLSNIGGQTEFANCYAAYEALPQATKDRIAKLRVVHSFEASMRNAGVESTPETLDYWRSVPVKTHNLVWTHDDGRKSLVIGCSASHIEGMDKAESDQLLQELLDWSTQPRFVYRHEWTPGDLVIWDNTGVLHRAEPYPIDSGRVMRRTTLVGEEAFA
ncbi:MAG: TauD/TfdA family dioxygenase [Spongiibacteraceae bacterium]